MTTPEHSIPSARSFRERLLHSIHAARFVPDALDPKAAEILTAVLAQYDQDNPPAIEFEKEAIARALGAVLPESVDWQHIREGAQAFVDTVNAWAEGGGLSINDSANEAAADDFFGEAE